MAFFITLIVVLAALLCLFYVLLVSSYCYAWVKMKTPVFTNELIPTKVSVIIAIRNEEKNIKNCIQALIQQNYPAQYVELILVDDASEDTTNEIINQFCQKQETIKLITLPADAEKAGKKYALTKGIHLATGELIVTTDADCVMGKDWLKTIVACYEQTHAQMIVAPVTFYDEKSVFEKMQTLEFMSLIVSGGASLYYNNAILCNGANLAYPKKVFYEVNGFEGVSNKASGDDVLLMYKIKNKYTDGVTFLKHTDALVFTKAQATLKGFIDQRKRWSSKGFAALNKETKRVALIVYLFNLTLFLLLFMPLVNVSIYFKTINLSEFYFLLFGIKCLIDFLLLFLATSFFKKRIYWAHFLVEEFLYVFYVVFIGLSGWLNEYEWKGRKTK